MSDPLASCKACLDHAEQRIEDFKREDLQYARSIPFTQVVEHNQDKNLRTSTKSNRLNLFYRHHYLL